jgi:uncharacterized protein YndB with AHSA1/START domain
MMVTTSHATSTAPPEAFFSRWADMATWPQWNTDTEWVRLDGPFATGSTGVLKPKGGPKVRFVIERLVPGHEFVDVSLLFGARLTFDHRVTAAGGTTTVDVTVSIDGPLARVWNLILGKGFRATAQPDLDALVRTAEHDAQVRR